MLQFEGSSKYSNVQVDATRSSASGMITSAEERSLDYGHRLTNLVRYKPCSAITQSKNASVLVNDSRVLTRWTDRCYQLDWVSLLVNVKPLPLPFTDLGTHPARCRFS